MKLQSLVKRGKGLIVNVLMKILRIVTKNKLKTYNDDMIKHDKYSEHINNVLRTVHVILKDNKTIIDDLKNELENINNEYDNLMIKYIIINVILFLITVSLLYYVETK